MSYVCEALEHIIYIVFMPCLIFYMSHYAHLLYAFAKTLVLNTYEWGVICDLTNSYGDIVKKKVTDNTQTK
jgi:hypothetical protein